MQLRSYDGDYFPSFFTIQLDTNVFSDDFSPCQNSTCIHEYIHFIQDLILPYCIRTNLSYMRLFNNVCKYAKEHNKIDIPFTDWDSDEFDLKQQFDFTFGSGKAKKISISGISISEEYKFSGFDQHNKCNRNLTVYKYKINFINGSSYHLGARDLLEYIAYRIESKHFNIGSDVPDYPYKTLDILFDHLAHSKLSVEKRVMIAEICLHNDNPIHFLFNVIIGKGLIKEIIHAPVNRFADLLYKNFATQSVDGIVEPFSEKEERRLNDFLMQLSTVYRHSDLLIKWISSVNDFSRKKFQGTLIFTNLYRMKNDEFKVAIREMSDALGFPIVINMDEKILNGINLSDSSIDDLKYFYMVERFINFTEKNILPSKKCPIGNFCKQNYKITCDKKFKVDKSSNCPFLEFLKKNHIDGIQFQKNK